MLPKHHIIYGLIFTILFYLIFPSTSILYLSLIFLSSFLIDFDHYINAVIRTKSISMKRAYAYYMIAMEKQNKIHKKGLKQKEEEFQFFHTIEFHLFVFALGFIFNEFFYILIGMVFHSLLDVYALSKENKLYLREYFFFSWLKREIFSK